MLKTRNFLTLGIWLVTGSFLIIFCNGAAEEISLSNSSQVQMEKQHSTQIIISKSTADRRNYRGLVLENGIKVILVSDPNTTEAAASLSVSVGSMDDPPTLEGLAHFLEHMLFFGNEKYPEENSYSKYIGEHGGYASAGTGRDNTYYYYRVSSTVLKESLDRFAHLFISPLLAEAALEREVHAVESEYQKNIPDDYSRYYRIQAGTGKPGHPFTKFTTGSIDTLQNRPRQAGINVRSALLDFHRNYYTAARMHLAVLGSEGLDELQGIVEQIFGEIPTSNGGNGTMGNERNTTTTNWSNWTQVEPLYGENELMERLEIVPIGNNVRSLRILFQVPYIPQNYQNTAVGYIVTLLGQQGPGSLSVMLKGKQWVESLNAWNWRPTQGLHFLEVNADLTQDGLSNVDRLVKYVFEYIEMMREEGPQPWLWEEARDINLLNFRFKDEENPLALVDRLSGNMIENPMDKVLLAGGIDESLEFDPVEINRTLTFLTPQNCRLLVTSKEFENATQFVEEIYGIHYNRRKLDPELIQNWTVAERIPEFYLPKRNEFIATKFDFKPRDGQSLVDPLTPRKLVDSNLSQLWYLQDTNFLLPKAFVTVELLTPLAYADPIQYNLLSIWSSLIEKSLEFQSAAGLAGLWFHVWVSEGGLGLSFQGYDHKLVPLVRKTFLRIQSLSASLSSETDNFATAKDSLLQLLLNRDKGEPRYLANGLLYQLLHERTWPKPWIMDSFSASKNQSLDAISDLTLEKLQIFISQFLSRLRFRWTFYGNLTPQECTQLASECESLFTSNGTRPLFPSERPWTPMRVIELPPGSNFVYWTTTPSHSSSCTTHIYQIGLDSTRNSILVSLLVRISDQHLFDQLRSKEALGYTVIAEVYADNFYATVSYRIIVQGNAAPAHVEQRIDSFLLGFEDLLANMTEQEFLRHRKSLADNIQSTSPKTMDSKFWLLRREIISQRGNFNRSQVELAALDVITLKDLQDFYREKVINTETRRRLAIHILPLANSTNLNSIDSAGSNDTTSISDDHFSSSNATAVKDITIWKETMRLFPRLNPFTNK